MNLGANQKVAFITKQYSRGRMLRAGLVAVFLMLPTLPLPEGHFLIPFLDWGSKLGAMWAAMLTTQPSGD